MPRTLGTKEEQKQSLNDRLHEINRTAVKKLNDALRGVVKYEAVRKGTAQNEEIRVADLTHDATLFLERIRKTFTWDILTHSTKELNPTKRFYQRKKSFHKKQKEYTSKKSFINYRISESVNLIRCHYLENLALVRSHIENIEGPHIQKEKTKTFTDLIEWHLNELRKIYNECAPEENTDDVHTNLLATTTRSTTATYIADSGSWIDIFETNHYSHHYHTHCSHDNYWYWEGFFQGSSHNARFGGWDAYIGGGYGRGYIDGELFEFMAKATYHIGRATIEMGAEATQAVVELTVRGIQATAEALPDALRALGHAFEGTAQLASNAAEGTLQVAQTVGQGLGEFLKSTGDVAEHLSHGLSVDCGACCSGTGGGSGGNSDSSNSPSCDCDCGGSGGGSGGGGAEALGTVGGGATVVGSGVSGGSAGTETLPLTKLTPAKTIATGSKSAAVHASIFAGKTGIIVKTAITGTYILLLLPNILRKAKKSISNIRDGRKLNRSKGMLATQSSTAAVGAIIGAIVLPIPFAGPFTGATIAALFAHMAGKTKKRRSRLKAAKQHGDTNHEKYQLTHKELAACERADIRPVVAVTTMQLLRDLEIQEKHKTKTDKHRTIKQKTKQALWGSYDKSVTHKEILSAISSMKQTNPFAIRASLDSIKQTLLKLNHPCPDFGRAPEAADPNAPTEPPTYGREAYAAVEVDDGAGALAGFDDNDYAGTTPTAAGAPPSY